MTTYQVTERDGDHYIIGLADANEPDTVFTVGGKHPRDMLRALYSLFQCHDGMRSGDRFETSCGAFECRDVHVVPADGRSLSEPGTITLHLETMDGIDRTHSFKTLDEARAFAHERVGQAPDISHTFDYAVGAHGDVKISPDEGCTLKELFPLSHQGEDE